MLTDIDLLFWVLGTVKPASGLRASLLDMKQEGDRMVHHFGYLVDSIDATSSVGSSVSLDTLSLSSLSDRSSDHGNSITDQRRSLRRS